MKKKGLITVIHGPMFSGKTEELLRRMRRAKIARKTTQIFKPQRDNRYARDHIIPHHLVEEQNGREENNFPAYGERAISVKSSQEIEGLLDPLVDTVGIEEGQFFDDGLFELVESLSDRGIAVVLSMLDMDFRRRPFPLPGGKRHSGDFLAVAHESLKLTAICVVCGNPAQYSQKLVFVQEYPSGQPVYVPASAQSETISVGTSQENSRSEASGKHPAEVYEARCLQCHELPD